MNMLYITSLLLVLFIILWWVKKMRSPKKLLASVAQKYIQKIRATKNQPPAFAVLKSHKFFVLALKTLHKNPPKTAAQTIAAVQHRWPNKHTIWQHHRLRNTIAHADHTPILPHQAEQVRKDLIQALRYLQ